MSWCTQDAALRIRLLLTHFLFSRYGGGPSESLWTLQLQLSRGGFSKPLDTATILQRAVTVQCTNCRLCIWPLHSIHCQPACPSTSSRLPPLIQMFLMLALKQKMMKSLAKPGIGPPILTSNNLQLSKAEGQTGEAMEEASASYADDQHIPPSVTAEGLGMLKYFCLFLLEFQTNKSIATM